MHNNRVERRGDNEEQIVFVQKGKKQYFRLSDAVA